MSGLENFVSKNNGGLPQYYIAKNQAESIKTEQAAVENKAVETKDSAATNPVNEVPKETIPATVPDTTIRDEFVKEKKNNGLVGKFYNFLKNKSGIGLGSKKVEAEIDKFEKGEITEEQAREKISQYKISRENAVQQTGDLAAAAVSISSFYLLNNQAKKLKARFELGALPEILRIDKSKDELKNSRHAKYIKKLESIVKSKGKLAAYMLPVLALIGGVTKLQTLQLERITSKEFSTDKKLPKKERKQQKKLNNIAKREQDLKNFGTGAVAGLLAPVTALAGGIVGVPAYLAATTGLRYAASNNDEKKKSFDDFAKTLKDNAAVNTVAAALIAVPAFKHANYSKVLGTNLEKVVNKLKGKKLHLPDLPSQKTAYQELEDKMLNSESIQKILNTGEDLNVEANMNDLIKRLTEENIFAVKFLQIKNSGILKAAKGEFNHYSMVSEALRENCPPTRTLEQAQDLINSLWGSREYTISKLLGVGTVAETYLAKDKSGKEVCIKVLKEGITAEKIAADKEKLVKLITGDTPINKLTEDQKYLLRNIDDLAEGISKEVDFKNEMEAAKELKKYCKVADVVVPHAAKDGIYVMERAEGISVKTLVDYYNCERSLKSMKKWLAKNPDSDWAAREIDKLEKQMEKIKSRSPEFEEFEMTPAQIKKLLNSYIDLQIEQFSKIDKNGKVIHADIHPGNIFINLKNLQSGKGKLFTLIDTGNTIKLSKEQAKASMRVIPYIKNGNYKELSKIVLDGAVLPKGLSEADALAKIEADLKKFFFDSETKIETMNIDTFYALSDNILRKYSIIPNNTQLNLNKAKTSASNSFENLIESFFSKKYAGKNIDEMSTTEMAGTASRMVGDAMTIFGRFKTAQTWQETKNLFQMSFKEAWNYLRNPNRLKTNSEDYLTFEMKQSMPGPNSKFNIFEEAAEEI